MSRAKIAADGEGRFYGIRFNCPGCALAEGGRGNVVLPVDWTPPGYQRAPRGESRAEWHFNGDLDLPTFSPSVLTRTGHHAGQSTDDCWCAYNREHPDDPAPFACLICHSFIRDGRIEFLSDCTHALAGQTVDLPEIDAPEEPTCSNP